MKAKTGMCVAYEGMGSELSELMLRNVQGALDSMAYAMIGEADVPTVKAHISRLAQCCGQRADKELVIALAGVLREVLRTYMEEHG